MQCMSNDECSFWYIYFSNALKLRLSIMFLVLFMFSIRVRGAGWRLCGLSATAAHGTAVWAATHALLIKIHVRVKWIELAVCKEPKPCRRLGEIEFATSTLCQPLGGCQVRKVHWVTYDGDLASCPLTSIIEGGEVVVDIRLEGLTALMGVQCALHSVWIGRENLFKNHILGLQTTCLLYFLDQLRPNRFLQVMYIPRG